MVRRDEFEKAVISINKGTFWGQSTISWWEKKRWTSSDYLPEEAAYTSNCLMIQRN